MRNLLEDVKAERATMSARPSNDELGVALNKIAWKNRDDGWGLSRKAFGEHCLSPAGPVANNVLHHQPSNQIVQVFSRAGEDAAAAFNVVPHHNHPDRPWVAPVDPAGAGGGTDGGGGGGGAVDDELFKQLVDGLLADTERIAVGLEAIATVALQLPGLLEQFNARLDRALAEGLRFRLR